MRQRSPRPRPPLTPWFFRPDQPMSAGLPFGSTVRYVVADSAPCESWVDQDSGLVAYQYTHPASRAVV
eukprot:11285629-Alexandrium_andersonii.AAC.1